MQEDNNIPVLTDLIEKGTVDKPTTAEAETTELVIEDTTEAIDATDLLIEDETEVSDGVELLLDEIPDREESDRTEMRSYEYVDDGVETDASSVDFLIDAKPSGQAMDDMPLPDLLSEDGDQLDDDLEDTIQRIIDKHMDQAMHEIRLALQLRKR